MLSALHTGPSMMNFQRPKCAQPSLRQLSSPQMSAVDGLGCFANSAGTVVTGYLAGAATGPAISALAATGTAVKNGSRSWDELKTTIGLSFAFSALAFLLATTAASLGATAVSLAPPLIQIPLAAVMLIIIVALVPVTALVTGTMASPAVPFRDKDQLAEYQDMQKSYNSDAWMPPKLWRGTDNEDRRQS